LTQGERRFSVSEIKKASDIAMLYLDSI